MRGSRRAVLSLGVSTALVLCLASPATARAGDEPLRHELKLDLPVTVGAGAAWIASEVFKEQLAPRACRWCRSNPIDDAARSALRWSDTRRADELSDLAGFVLTPVTVLGLDALGAARRGGIDRFPVDLLIILQATLLAVDLNQAVKLAVGRERPFVHALDPELKAKTRDPADNNLSFFSGHATLTFALAVSAGTVASMRDYRTEPWIWAGGLTLAGATGYLRIAADKHYLTDVLVGAAVGSALGFAIPYVFHRPR